ncbi:MAG: cation:proton antiporter, partial [Cyanobacteria bacterium J06632_22]
TMKNLLPWQVIGMNVAALGTAISFSKFIFLPHGPVEDSPQKPLGLNFWFAMGVLLGGLILGNGIYYKAYSVSNIIKPLITIALGWLAYGVLFRTAILRLSRTPERFEHLIGTMSLMLTLLFWTVIA